MNKAKCVILFISAFPLISTAAVDYLRQGAKFTKARTLLIKDKWVPVTMHVNDNYVYDGVEKELIKRKFTEVDSCSNDSSRCILYYTKNSHCLRLDTIGEHVKDMKVVQWSEECPGSPPKKSTKSASPSAEK